MTTSVGLLAVQGGAMLTLKELRANSSSARPALASTVTAVRARTDLADLRSVARLCNLPMPRMTYSTLCGVVGRFAGTDKLIEYAVQEWATAFDVVAAHFEPVFVGRDRDGKAVVDSGWTLMQAYTGGLGFTVGGRLVQAVKTR